MYMTPALNSPVSGSSHSTFSCGCFFSFRSRFSQVTETGMVTDGRARLRHPAAVRDHIAVVHGVVILLHGEGGAVDLKIGLKCHTLPPDRSALRCCAVTIISSIRLPPMYTGIVMFPVSAASCVFATAL